MDYAPGSVARESGLYEQIAMFGVSTGISEQIARGERLPLAPQGYTWRKVLWTVRALSVVTEPRYTGTSEPPGCRRSQSRS